MTDVTVIGASLAGTTAAIALARHGLRVRLIDKAVFPRRKPCGEGMSGRGTQELSAIGFDLRKLELIARPLSGYRILTGSSSRDIPDAGGLIGVSRSGLDDMLLQYAASSPLIEQRCGVTVEGIERRGESFTIKTAAGSFSSPHLVIADGANSPSLRALGKKISSPRHPRLGTSSSWLITQGEIAPYVHTMFINGGEIYLTPLHGAQLNISVLGAKSLIQRAAHPALLREIVEPLLRRLGLEAHMTSPPLGSGPLNSVYHCAHYKGAFVVGDACETFDPCAGCGMTHALLSGRLAARHIAEVCGSSRIHEALNAYAQARFAEAQSLRGYTRLTSLMMQTTLGKMALPLATSLGLAGMISQSVNSSHGSARIKQLVALLGRPG